MTTVCLTFDFDALSIWLSTFKLNSQAASPLPAERSRISG